MITCSWRAWCIEMGRSRYGEGLGFEIMVQSREEFEFSISKLCKSESRFLFVSSGLTDALKLLFCFLTWYCFLLSVVVIESEGIYFVNACPCAFSWYTVMLVWAKTKKTRKQKINSPALPKRKTKATKQNPKLNLTNATASTKYFERQWTPTRRHPHSTRPSEAPKHHWEGSSVLPNP